MNEEDPFLQVQHDVLAQMQTARPLFASYLRIRSLSSTPAQSPEVASARSDLESALSTLAEDLADLVESVRAVESDPEHYGLSAHEVSRRKKLVDEVGGEVADMREELARQTAELGFPPPGPSSSSSGSRAVAAARAAANDDLLPPSAFALDDAASARGGGDDDDDNEDGYAEFEHRQQLQVMREQDHQLDDVFVTVGNLRRQADDMGRELEEQHEMLEHVDTLADRVGGRLQTGMQKLGYVMRRSEDRYSSCCIALLITVLIILLVLLLVL